MHWIVFEDETENAAVRRNGRMLYQIMKQASRNLGDGAVTLVNNIGNVIRSEKAAKINGKNDSRKSGTIHIPVSSIPPSEELRRSTAANMPPTTEDIANTIKRLKNIKAADEDKLATEIYKHAAGAILSLGRALDS